MQIASCRLMISDNGSDVAVANVTPAELVILAVEHQNNAKKYPITDLKVRPNQDAASIDRAAEFYDHTDEEVIYKTLGKKNDKGEWKPVDKDDEGGTPILVGHLKTAASYRKRTDPEELVRLTRKYGEKKVKALWSDISPTLPQTFDEAEKIVKNRIQTAPSLADVTTSEATVQSSPLSKAGPPPANAPATASK